MSTKTKAVLLWIAKETFRGAIFGVAVFLAIKFGAL